MVFLIKLWLGKTWDMHKRAFQALKRTFIHVSGLPPPFCDKKTKRNVRFFPQHILIKNQLLFKLFFFNQNMVGEDVGP